MTDHETRSAADHLAGMLRVRDAANRNGQDCADDEVFALEFITALRARGWRPTEAKPAPAWKRPAGSGSMPPSDVLRELRADLAAKAAASRQARDGDAS